MPQHATFQQYKLQVQFCCCILKLIYALHSQYYEKLSLEYMIEQIGIVQFVGRI
jgi:hypothetical protein